MTVIWPTIPEIWSVTNRIFVILDHFLPIYIKILKWKNCLKISPFYTCTRNGNHMYGSWDIKCNRQNCLLFWVIFCPITPLTILKIKLLKKSSFTHFTPLLEKAWSYAILFLRYRTWQKKCIFKFGLFFALLPP